MLEPIFQLLKKSNYASLATADSQAPLVTLVGYIFLTDYSNFGQISLLLSGIARHTKNIRRHNRVSLMICDTDSKRSAHELSRVTLIGELHKEINKNEHAILKQEYLKKYPKSDIFFTLKDFHFYTLKPSEIHWIQGFAQAQTLLFKDGQWQSLSQQENEAE